MNKLIIIRGISGSGKSTLAAAKALELGCAFLEADSYFSDEKGNYNFDPSKLRQAHLWCQIEAKNQLDIGNSVIVSNTFTTAKELIPYLKMAIRASCKVEVLEPRTAWKNDVQECHKRNTHHVPLNVLQAQLDRWLVIPEGEYEAQDLLERCKGVTNDA